MGDAEPPGEGLEAWDLRHRGDAMAAVGDDHPREDLAPRSAALGRGDEPAVRVVLEAFDAGAEPDARGDPHGLGVAAEIGEHLLARRIGGGSLGMIEAGEGGHDAAGVGAHAGSGGAARSGAVPLATDGGDLEDDRLEAPAQEMGGGAGLPE